MSQTPKERLDDLHRRLSTLEERLPDVWDVASVAISLPNTVSEYLEQGYEPFAVSHDPATNKERLWLKRRRFHEVYSQPREPDQGTGRPAHRPAKGTGSS